MLDRRVQLQVLGPPGELLIAPPPYWFGPRSKVVALPIPRELPARVVLPADLPPGQLRWQVANANGASTTGLFIVGTGPEVVEEERRKGPQTLPALPVTVSGRLLKNEEVDRYRFTAPRTGPVTCELTARRLGANFFGAIEVRDREGRLVAEAVDTQGLDPVLTFAARAGAEYVVSVRDIDHAGDRSFVYRLAVTPGPRVLAAIPAAGRRGETRPVEFVGIGVATGAAQLESVQRQITFPADATASTFDYRLETTWGAAPAFSLLVSDLPEVVAPTDRGRPGPTGGARRCHGSVRPDRRRTPLSAASARRVSAGRLRSRRGGSARRWMCRWPSWAPMARSWPATTTCPARRTPAWTSLPPPMAPISWSSATWPARAARALLSIGWSPCGRRMTSSCTSRPSDWVSTFGAKAMLTVKAVRTGAFQGPITLAFQGLPAGVRVPADLVIPAGKAELAVPLEAAGDAAAAASVVHATGTAILDGKTAIRPVALPGRETAHCARRRRMS